MPMSAALMAGRVVDPVAGHGHHLAVLLEGLDEKDLVLGGHPAHDSDVVDAGQPLRLGEGGEVGAEHRLAGDAQLLGDRRARRDVVAGDHADSDVGGLRLFDGGLGLGPGRIDHRHQAGHLQVVHVSEQVALGVEGVGVDVSHGGGHDTLSEAGHPFDVALGPAGQVCVPGDGGAARECRGRTFHDGRCRPLDEAADHLAPGGIGGLVEGSHELVGRVERERGEPRQAFSGAVDVDPGLVPENQQRPLGGIADHLSVDQLGVVGDEEGQDGVLEGVAEPAACSTRPSSP